MYIKIGDLKLLKIQVIQNGVTVYEGMVEDAPDEIKKYRYAKIMIDDDGITNLYVYSNEE